MRIFKLFWLLGLLFAASCAYRGDASDHFNRRFAYFSLANGDDIRAACQPGVERYRLIYNAVYDEHLRIYEIKRGPRDYHPVRTTVVTPGNITDGITSADVLSPWRGKESLTHLDDSTLNRLIERMEASGLSEPAPKGLRLPSDEFYWLGIGCRDGNILFQVWPHPSDRFSRISFDKLLFAIDGNEILPRLPGETRFAIRSGGSKEMDFTLHIGDKGLIR